MDNTETQRQHWTQDTKQRQTTHKTKSLLFEFIILRGRQYKGQKKKDKKTNNSP
jgi:hypothetical protein